MSSTNGGVVRDIQFLPEDKMHFVIIYSSKICIVPFDLDNDHLWNELESFPIDSVFQSRIASNSLVNCLFTSQYPSTLVTRTDVFASFSFIHYRFTIIIKQFLLIRIKSSTPSSTKSIFYCFPVS